MSDDDRKSFDDKVDRLRDRIGAGRRQPRAPEPLKPPIPKADEHEEQTPAPEPTFEFEQEPQPSEPPPPPPAEEKAGEWYYQDFVHRWPPGDRPNGHFGVLISGRQVKKTFWDEYQRDILPIVQQWLDDGWQPVSEVGPAALVLDDREQSALGKEIWPKRKRRVYLRAVKVRMRKRG